MSTAAANMVDVAAGEREAVSISERCAKRILKVRLICGVQICVEFPMRSCLPLFLYVCVYGLRAISVTLSSPAKVQPEGYLRLRVDGGGCSGFQYKFELDTEKHEDDAVFEKAGAKLIIDETSLDLVRGSTIAFVEEMISSSFQVVNNPNSESNCGCGASFAPKM